MPPVVHPLTGEVLPDDVGALLEAERLVDRYLRAQARHYAFRGDLRERIAELDGPAVLPRPRWRSNVQQRVSECPRCGAKS